MHPSAFLKAKLFVDTYLSEAGRPLRVIDIGAKAHLDHESNRSLFPPSGFEYVGLDVEPGPNVDVIVNGYVWPELPDDSFDVAISSQTFEHNPFFWVTFCEMARILRPSGFLFVSAPGSGTVHRYPYDCWRFYPDSWLALCRLSGLEMIESYFEPDTTFGDVNGGKWRDSTVIAQHPTFANSDQQAAFNQRLRALVAPYGGIEFGLGSSEPAVGPCFRAYEQAVKHSVARAPFKRKLKRALRRVTGYSIGPIFRYPS